MSNYKLQMYTPNVGRQVFLFQRRLYRSFTWRHAAYFEWNYIRNPYMETPLVYVALHKDRVVGFRAMFGTCWEGGTESGRVVLPIATDSGIDSEHRNTGLFEDLTAFCMEDVRAQGYNHVLNLTATPENYVVSIMTMGWKPIGSLETLIRGTPSAMGSRLGETAKKVAGIGGYVLMDQNARNTKEPISISKKPRPQAMADLAERVGSDNRLRHVRDETYYAWRFNNPRYCYRFLYLEGSELEGYMVLQNKVGHSHVNIVDWEGRDIGTVAALLESAIELGGFESMGVWSMGLAKDSREIFMTAGFGPAAKTLEASTRYSNRFMFKPLNPDAEHILGWDPADPSSWDMRMIYSDGG